MITRAKFEKAIITAIKRAPITSILGPRQCGKTTIAKEIAKQFTSTYYDLESATDIARLEESPQQTLSRLKGLVIIDEIQRKPELFPILRVLADRPDSDTRFLILGSASPTLVKGVSESLAGRVEFVDMTGFQLDEVGNENLIKLWLRGGFPRSFLAPDDEAGFAWRQNFLQTVVERDIPQLGFFIASDTLLRFWRMVAHSSGQIWNASQLASSLGVTGKIVRNYLDIFSSAYMIRQLQPWYENLKKRQVKSPKIYIRDTGLLHTLLALPGDGILSHPQLGASWEGFVIEHINSIFQPMDLYFWRSHAGAELDLLLFHRGRRFGFEIKYADAPRTTKSMHVAINDLQLDHLYIVYSGSENYQLNDKITSVGITNLQQLADSI